ncbi:hypothetical protein Q2420_25395 [Escherichia coli]|nr:hypothetical protein [Escherichia coli]
MAEEATVEEQQLAEEIYDDELLAGDVFNLMHIGGCGRLVIHI